MAPARLPSPSVFIRNRMTGLPGSLLTGEVGAAGDAGVDGDDGAALLVLLKVLSTALQHTFARFAEVRAVFPSLFLS